MKLFRKIKYRLRRFIISLISVLCLCSVFIVSASADVISPSGTGQITTRIQPFYWDGYQWQYSPTFTFQPGLIVDTGFTPVNDEAFGMTYNVYSVNDGTYYGGNVFSVPVGTLHFRISFDTNKYFTSPLIPYIDFVVKIPDESAGGQITTERIALYPESFTTNYSVTRYGNQHLWNYVTDIYIDSSFIPYSNFSSFYFYLQRGNYSSSSSDTWQITFKEFVCEVLTGADAPKYSQPDTSAKNELDSVEGELNDSINSFGSDIGSIFSFDDLYDLVVPGITFWGATLEKFFNLDFVRPILILSLACGIFALLFGLVGTLVSRSNTKQSQSKSSKSKGG